MIELVQYLYGAAIDSLCLDRAGDIEAINALANAWPEYVIGSKNPLTFLDPLSTPE
ncbi:hypothetical protein ACMA5I_10845 [Paracoccaceae bacterium GXU_MW_L88]